MILLKRLAKENAKVFLCFAEFGNNTNLECLDFELFRY